MKILLSVLAIAYLISPYDLFPDFFPGLGWIDDLVVMGLLWWYLYAYRRRQYDYQRQRSGSEGPRTFGNSDGGSEEEKSTYHEPKDPYTVLKVDPQASQKEIREAYLELANQYHPDKVLHLGEEFKQLAESRFKEIQCAYEALKIR